MKAKIQAMNKATKRGLTLIEALLFLGIAAVVIVGAVILYNNTSNSARTNEALTQLQSYSTGVKGLYSGTSSYGTGSILPAVINGGVAPRSAVNGTNLVNPWGDGTAIFGNGGTFHIYFQNVPQDSCVRILTAGILSQGSITNMWVANGGAMPTAVQTVPPAGPSSFNAVTPPTPATAAVACANANNNIHFEVR